MAIIVRRSRAFVDVTERAIVVREFVLGLGHGQSMELGHDTRVCAVIVVRGPVGTLQIGSRRDWCQRDGGNCRGGGEY